MEICELNNKISVKYFKIEKKIGEGRMMEVIDVFKEGTVVEIESERIE